MRSALCECNRPRQACPHGETVLNSFVRDGSTGIFTDCTFSRNWAGSGSGLSVSDPKTSVTLTNCVFRNHIGARSDVLQRQS